MLLSDIDNYFSEILKISDFPQDSALNGIQVGKKDKNIRKIAFAVDGCLMSMKAAVESRADVLFVHHGLFWGGNTPVTGSHYDRLDFLIKNDLALYAVHLPLDACINSGNNIYLAEKLKLTDIQPFGFYKGKKIGFKGNFKESADIYNIVRQLGRTEEDCLSILPFGKKEILSVGIVSGGAATDVFDAASEGLDLFITGEISHTVYHFCLENRINMLCLGHYYSEMGGVIQVKNLVEKNLNLETVFIDLPTGL